MTQNDAVELTGAAKQMLDQIPGLLSIEVGSALEITKAHTQGYDWGVVVTLESPRSFAIYANHPSHDE